MFRSPFRTGLLALLLLVQAVGVTQAYAVVVWHHEHDREMQSALPIQHASEAEPTVLPEHHGNENQHVTD